MIFVVLGGVEAVRRVCNRHDDKPSEDQKFDTPHDLQLIRKLEVRS